MRRFLGADVFHDRNYVTFFATVTFQTVLIKCVTFAYPRPKAMRCSIVCWNIAALVTNDACLFFTRFIFYNQFSLLREPFHLDICHNREEKTIVTFF